MRIMMSKKLLLNLLNLVIFIGLLIFSQQVVFAAPASPIEVTLSQPDGTEFQAIGWGDEWLNGMETIEGYTITRDFESDFWVYYAPEDSLAPNNRDQTPLIVGQDDPGGLPKHLRPEQPVEGFGASSLQLPERALSPENQNIGTQPVLVLLVEFENWSGQTPAQEWSNKIFGPTNSVGEYYFDVSFENLILTPASEQSGTPNDGIIDWIKLPYNHPNTYNKIGRENLEITRNAIMAANDSVNFAAFDNNSDGYLSTDELHVIVIVAGHEGAYGGADTCQPGVWAHQYYLDYGNVTAPSVDGVRVGSYNGGGAYTQFGEIHCEIENAPGHPASIGIIAHEFGHDLDWPDLYDVSLFTKGIGNWGLMSTGMWNRSDDTSPVYGDVPAHPTAWSLVYQGWVDPIQMTTSTLNITIPPVATSGVIYQLRYNPNGVDWVWQERSGVGEYFLVENRQKSGYDLGLPGAGVLIWHIDESVTYTNYANADRNHRLVDLIQADGLRQLNTLPDNRGDSGDPYPGITGNTTFNAASTPSSALYFDIPSGVSITSIGQTEPGFMANFFVRSFQDVIQTDWYWPSVESLAASRITAGCDEENYCPGRVTTRSETAVFLLRAKFGVDFMPEPAVGQFEDLDLGYWAVDWIEQLYVEGISAGCSLDPLQYCPESPITRAELAVLLLRTKYGQEFTPEPANGFFSDLAGYEWAADWIEHLFREGITAGCTAEPLQYCPADPVTRAEMAALIAKTFDLPLP